MKKYFPIILLLFTSNASAQIPVTDTASIGQQAAEFILQAKRFAETVLAREAQLEQLQLQFESITGT